MASVSSRPERKLDEIVTPRAAMMTVRMNQRQAAFHFIRLVCVHPVVKAASLGIPRI
jgi:hypothetical protein